MQSRADAAAPRYIQRVENGVGMVLHRRRADPEEKGDFLFASDLCRQRFGDRGLIESAARRAGRFVVTPVIRPLRRTGRAMRLCGYRRCVSVA